MHGRRLRNIGATLFTVVAVVILAALATGEIRLVTTHGVSMLPRFHSGDLAVILRAPSYRVGEIVGYYSPLLHIIVLHRIVAEHGGRFTFKGDHNNFLDPLKLSSGYVRGHLVLHVPKGGTVLGWFRTPLGLALLAFAALTFGVTRSTRLHRNRRRRARTPGVAARSEGAPRTGPKHAAPATTSVSRWPVAVPLACAAIFALFSVVAGTRATTRTVDRPATYEQQVAFSYLAKVPKGAAYPSGEVVTGEPVFLHLAKDVQVTARYRIRAGVPTGAGPSAVSGTIGATVELQGPGGWRGQLVTVAPKAFSGPSGSVGITLSLSRITALEQAFAQETGVGLGTANVVVTPHVAVHGRIGASRFFDSYAPSLPMQMSGIELTLVPSGPGSGSSEFPQLDAEQSGTLSRAVSVPATMDVLGRTLGVTTAFRVALALLAATLVAAVMAWTWVERRRRLDEPARIRAGHRQDLVAVSTSPAVGAALVVDVETFGGLGRLADRYDCMILELEHAQGHTYYVECGATVYRYGTEPTEPPPWRDGDPDRPRDLTYHVGALRSVS